METALVDVACQVACTVPKPPFEVYAICSKSDEHKPDVTIRAYYSLSGCTSRFTPTNSNQDIRLFYSGPCKVFLRHTEDCDNTRLNIQTKIYCFSG